MDSFRFLFVFSHYESSCHWPRDQYLGSVDYRVYPFQVYMQNRRNDHLAFPHHLHSKREHVGHSDDTRKCQLGPCVQFSKCLDISSSPVHH